MLPTSVPFVNWRSNVNASRPWSVWRTVRDPSRCSATSTVARISGEANLDSCSRFAATGTIEAIDIQLALADSVGAAWALAHTTPFSIVPAGEEASALSSLPVETLRLPAAVLERLHDPGIGDDRRCAAAPARVVGQPIRGRSCLERLDQALGLRPESFVCERLNEPLCDRPRVGDADRRPPEPRRALPVRCCESSCRWRIATAWVSRN